MKKNLVLLILWVLASAAFGSWRDIYPMPEIPAKEKELQDYSVEDVWRCAIDNGAEDIFPEGHPFQEKGMAGIKANWSGSKDPQKAKKIILLAISSAQEYANKKEERYPGSWYKSSFEPKQKSLIDVSALLRDGFDLTARQKREVLLTLAKNEKDEEKQLLLVYTSLRVARDTLDVELLKYGSKFMHESRLAVRFQAKGQENRTYIERSYGRILSAEIKNVVDLIQTGKLKNTSYLPSLSVKSSKELQTWLMNNWQLLEEKKSQVDSPEPPKLEKSRIKKNESNSKTKRDLSIQDSDKLSEVEETDNQSYFLWMVIGGIMVLIAFFLFRIKKGVSR